MSSKARAAMRAFLELDEAGRADFDKMRDDYDYVMRYAEALPSRHPEKGRRRQIALSHFRTQYAL